MLLQGFDSIHLRETHAAELQVGATDQWGNITVGTELARRKTRRTVWGLVFPLLTKADGTKYGKTVDGAVLARPKRTSPYRFYQFFVNADDADAASSSARSRFSSVTGSMASRLPSRPTPALAPLRRPWPRADEARPR